jgi:hypothetical protein
MGWFTGSSSSHGHSHRGSYVRSSSGSVFSRSSSHHGHGGHHSSSSSYYKRRPRDGYISRLYHKLKHLLKELYYFARRHPVKIFFMVVMPLISGGVLHNVARNFGISLPAMLRGSAGKSGGGGYDSYYGSSGYERESSGGGAAGLMGNLGNVGSLLKMAQAFM